MNPFYKSFGKEDFLQEGVFNYFCMRYNKYKSKFVHVPNEGKRGRLALFKFKVLGGRGGVSDILIFVKNEEYSGLAIELKIGTNKPTDNQKSFLSDLKEEGWNVNVSYTFDDAKEIIDNYMKNIK